MHAVCGRLVAYVVEEHAIHAAALGTAGETPMVGVWVVALCGSAEEVYYVKSLFVAAHRGSIDLRDEGELWGWFKQGLFTAVCINLDSHARALRLAEFFGSSASCTVVLCATSLLQYGKRITYSIYSSILQTSVTRVTHIPVVPSVA